MGNTLLELMNIINGTRNIININVIHPHNSRSATGYLNCTGVVWWPSDDFCTDETGCGSLFSFTKNDINSLYLFVIDHPVS